MRQAHRLLAAGFAASIALSLPVSAGAAPGGPALAHPVLTAKQQSEAHAAADWIVEQLAGADHFPAGGDTVDALVALAAAGNHDDVARKLGAYLQDDPAAKEYASVQPGAAAKVVIGLDAACMDTSAYDQMMLKDMKDDGSLPGFASAFNHSLVIIALERSGQEIPPVLVEKLKSWQTAEDGGFEYDDFVTGGKVYDVDGGAMGAMALQVAGEDEAAERALDSLRAHQEAPGYWPNYSPVNSTGLVVHALEIDGRDVSKAQAWMKTQQLSDGGFPASLDGDTSNVMATIQGMQAIAGAGYTNADLGCEAEPTPEPTSPEPSGPVADTGVEAKEGDGQLAAAAMGGLLLLAGAPSRLPACVAKGSDRRGTRQERHRLPERRVPGHRGPGGLQPVRRIRRPGSRPSLQGR
ncbi:hypothetical protein BJF82_11540 [Kytococcus sp. CUA-901]|nr:hypothetical protein BJF82_11540 [Kytococcus sp. CUA-901]